MVSKWVNEISPEVTGLPARRNLKRGCLQSPKLLGSKTATQIISCLATLGLGTAFRRGCPGLHAQSFLPGQSVRRMCKTHSAFGRCGGTKSRRPSARREIPFFEVSARLGMQPLRLVTPRSQLDIVGPILARKPKTRWRARVILRPARS